jgi:hypothetical protein
MRIPGLLTKLGSAGDRKPSLSQWLDPVGEPGADNTSALTSCLHPTIAGGKRREREDAKPILHKPNRTHTPERTLYARFLVRWLPEEMHASLRDG